MISTPMIDACGLLQLTANALVLSSASLASEAVECDVGIKSGPALLMAEKEETIKKSLGQRLRDKLNSMVCIHRGFTVDRCTAFHVMPWGCVAWIIFTASLGSLKGVHFISADGAIFRTQDNITCVA